MRDSLFFHIFTNFEAVGVGEHQVKHNEVGFFGIEIFDEAGSIREFPHAEMVLFEMKGNQFQNVLFVIDDGYVLAHGSFHLESEDGECPRNLFHFIL